MDWSWSAWAVSVAAVVASGAVAWLEQNWRTRPGLAMGFVNHGGMWGDLILLPMANAVIVPHLTVGIWMVPAVMLSMVASVAVHKFWYRRPMVEVLQADGFAHEEETHARSEQGDHIWPAHARGTWAGDLSWSGWAHVIYVTGELALVCGFVLHSVPPDVVLFVTAIFTLHVPIGVLQPRWFRTGHIATVSEQPLLAPLLMTLWAVAFVKL